MSSLRNTYASCGSLSSHRATSTERMCFFCRCTLDIECWPSLHPSQCTMPFYHSPSQSGAFFERKNSTSCPCVSPFHLGRPVRWVEWTTRDVLGVTRVKRLSLSRHPLTFPAPGSSGRLCPLLSEPYGLHLSTHLGDDDVGFTGVVGRAHGRIVRGHTGTLQDGVHASLIHDASKKKA